MRYISTRGLDSQAGLGFSDILLAGLAPDGGLFLPESYPELTSQLDELRDLLASDGYPGVAHRILTAFIDDIDSADLLAICRRAYSAENFGGGDIVPVTRLGDEDIWLAHLSQGPTAAFKDMAMQLLGQLFGHELERRDSTLNILGATSGDTGSAAEYAMLGQPRISVFMLTPKGRMTPFQQAQMFSIDDPRVINIAVEGVFDDCQDLVKAVSQDLDFKSQYRIGAVNSINWARLLAQVVYYVVAWLRVSSGSSEQVNFCVPSGNFGNICAGHIARQMGVPIRQLVLATNENDVLHEFFSTGVYRVRGSSETHQTSSPSMDISKASNFERFIFDLLGRDARRVRQLFAVDLATTGEFDLSDTSEFASLRDTFGFVSGSSTHTDRVNTIADVWHAHRVMIDPHTADGVTVARRKESEVPTIVMETALPVKFASTIYEALGQDPEVPEEFAGLLELPRHVIDLDADVSALKGLIVDRLAELDR